MLYDTLGRKGCRENLGWLEDHPNAANLEVLIGDVRLPTRPLQAAIERADALFHLAAQVAVTTSVSDPEYDFEVNALGTFKLLELVRNSRAKRPVVFYASTNKVYGGMEDVAIAEGQERYSYRDLPDGIPEDRLLDFHSPYGCSKGAADQYVRDYARIYGLETVVFRQSCIYGYRQFGLEDQGWVAWFIIAAILGRPITVFGDGKQVRDVLFIDDLIAAYDRAWARIESTRGQVYNVGGGPANAVSLRDLLAVLRAEVDPELAVAQAGWRPGDQPVYVSDVRRAAREFGWRPQVDWRSGVARLVDWVRDNRAMLERLF
ncbi:MAG: dTDP-D-glucose 4,6-dehydratase [Geminicoccaceae bacterium]|nr:dTDP-D-glucose 4,6-dehydratase [Geminicoccaceae bacterium]